MEIFSAACYTTSLEIDIKIETKILSNPCLAKGKKKSSKKKKQRQFEKSLTKNTKANEKTNAFNEINKPEVSRLGS